MRLRNSTAGNSYGKNAKDFMWPDSWCPRSWTIIWLESRWTMEFIYIHEVTIIKGLRGRYISSKFLVFVLLSWMYRKIVILKIWWPETNSYWVRHTLPPLTTFWPWKSEISPVSAWLAWSFQCGAGTLVQSVWRAITLQPLPNWTSPIHRAPSIPTCLRVPNPRFESIRNIPHNGPLWIPHTFSFV